MIASFDSTLLFPGGSLFNLLDDPENNFGLDEDEWLLVLSHLSAGMNHLRDNNLVHRFVEGTHESIMHISSKLICFLL